MTWEDNGFFSKDYDGIDRWVCNHCGKDFPLDLNTDILPHLAEDHDIGEDL
tara:strand:+ start:280 stop:432 length:153 start_codon:yes stop_codon:yes gene_type:complete